MVELSERERITLLMIIGFGDRKRSLQEACNLFNETFPDRISPISKSTVSRNLSKFNETGSVKNNPRSGRKKTATDEENALNVVLSVQEEPKTSVPKLALDNNMSERSVRRILKVNKFHPYKVQLHQELNEDDPDRRMQFCQVMMDAINGNNMLMNSIVFSDESTFCLNGFVNKHNCRYWSDHNPHWMEEGHTQYPQKLNVWAGIVRGRIIGPFFMRGTLNGDRYLQLLQEQIVPELVRLYPNHRNHLQLSDEIWFQQDGAPPHFDARVRQYLNTIFPQRWVGRRGHIEWPARSPDLTPLDFFLWGHLKSVVYKDLPHSLEELEYKIRIAVQEITPEVYQNALRSFVDRLGYCQAVGGFHFEHLL